MNNFTNRTQSNFTIIQNDLLNDKDVSFEVKGLYCFLVSKPDGWNFSAERISKQSKESESKVKRLLRELENLNLLKRTKIKSDSGHFDGIHYEILSTVGSKPADGKTIGGETDGRKTIGGKCTNISNTDYSNTNSSNTNEDISEDISIEDSIFLDLKQKVFKIWNVYSGKKMSFEVDYAKFLEKTKGVEIDFDKLYKNAYAYNKVYFQNWLNNFFPKSQKHFSKPTVDEINRYCQERNNMVDAQRFFDFYESKGWLVGKSKMKDWQACVRTWEKGNNNNNKEYGGKQKSSGKKVYQFDPERARKTLFGGS